MTNPVIALIVLSTLDLAGLITIFLLAERIAVRGRLLSTRHLKSEFKKLMHTARGVRQVALGGLGLLLIQGIFYLVRGHDPATGGIILASVLLLLEFVFAATFLSPNFWPEPGSEAAAAADIARLANSEKEPAPTARQRRNGLISSAVLLVIAAVILAFNHNFSGNSYPSGALGVAKRLEKADIGCMTTRRTITSSAPDAGPDESIECSGGMLILDFADHYFRDGCFKAHPGPVGRTVRKGLTAVECASPQQAASVARTLGGTSRVT